MEPCRALSPHCDSFVIYTLPCYNDCFRSLVVSLVHSGSITATSCLSDFLPISNDVCRPYSTPQFARYFELVTMATCLTPSRYCTGCVYQNGSTLNWRSWHTECWTVWRHRIWINSFRYLACQVVAVCGRRSRCSCTCLSTRLSTAGRRSFTVAASIFWNTLPDDVQSAPSVSSFRRQLKDIPVSPVISRHHSLNFCTALSWTLQQFRLL